MKPMCLWTLLFLSVSAPALSQQTASAESRLIVEAVECKGNTTIPCDFIRSKLHLPANSEVDGDAVQSAQLRLSALPNFESVRVYLEKGSEKGKARLIVDVVEASPIVTELSLGVRSLSTDYQSSQPNPSDQLGEYLTGRISHQNLFGRQKLGELTVGGNRLSGDEFDTSRINTSLSYIDPNLFGTEKWFLSVTGEYNFMDSRFEAIVNYPVAGSPMPVALQIDYEGRVWAISMSIGYRLWEYSYLFARIQQQNAHSQETITLSPPQFASGYDFKDQANVASIGYGWDSEDDAYFPTRGSRLSATVLYASVDEALCAKCDQLDWRIAYKHSWMMGRKSVWTVNVGGEPYAVSDRLRPVDASSAGTLGLKYSYLLDSSEALGGIRRGRWYLGLGTGPVELWREGEIGGEPDQAHVSFGLRFESKVLGIVDLYAMASEFWPQLRSVP